MIRRKEGKRQVVWSYSVNQRQHCIERYMRMEESDHRRKEKRRLSLIKGGRRGFIVRAPVQRAPFSDHSELIQSTRLPNRENGRERREGR